MKLRRLLSKILVVTVLAASFSFAHGPNQAEAYMVVKSNSTSVMGTKC